MTGEGRSSTPGISATVLYHSAQNFIYGKEGVTRDVRKGVELLRRAAEADHPRAMLEYGLALGLSYYFLKEDRESSDQWKIRAAVAGDPLAIARCVRDGLGPYGQDKKLSFRTLQQLDQTDPLVLFSIGTAYDFEDGAPKDPVKAVEYYQKSADLGYVQAIGNLQMSYMIGEGVEEDKAKAVQLCFQAVEQGHAMSMLRLASSYESGTGIRKDEEKAFEWYLKAAEQDVAAACRHVAVCYEDGTGVTRNAHRAFEYFLRAADLGDEPAQIQMGVTFSRPPRYDPARCFYYFKLAADQGSSIGEYNMGVCYERGDYVAQDTERALELFVSAAEKGSSEAQVRLGLLYFEGVSVEQDMNRAIEYWKQAAAQDNADAEYFLASSILSVTEIGWYEEEGMRLMISAASKHQPDACVRIGLCYESGLYFAANAEEAFRHYRIAAEQGDEAAVRVMYV